MTSNPVNLALGEHLDETGAPCTRHGTTSWQSLLGLAAVGSRVSGFNHDIASKLQGLMMALDEISEIAEGLDPLHREQVARAAEGAHGCLKEVLDVLNLNRAMTKPPMRSPVALLELTTRAGERVYAALDGTLPDVDVSVHAPTMIQALSLLFDVAGGPGRGRKIPVEVSRSVTHVSLSIAVASTGPPPPEPLALASFVLARDGGSLHCGDAGQRLVIALPLAT